VADVQSQVTPIRSAEMLTNRELATLILVVLGVAICVVVPSLRRSLGPGAKEILKAARHWSIITLLLLLLAWSVTCLYVAHLLGGWNFGLLKDAIIVILVIGIPNLFRVTEFKTGGAIFRRLGLESVGFIAIFGFYLNLEPFPLWAEILIQAAATFIALLGTVAGLKEETRPVQRLANRVLGLAAIGAFVWTTVQVVQRWNTFDFPEILRSFLLTIWLPLALIPFLYVVCFWAAADVLLTVRLRFLNDDRHMPPIRLQVAVLLGSRFRIGLLSKLSGRYNGIARETTFRGALRFMKGFREDVRTRRRAEDARFQSLKNNAGVKGTDDDGAQRDRREFDGTKQQLRQLSMSQMAHFRGQHKYWTDQLQIWVEPAKYGLPPNPGFRVETTRDGQRWRGWRELPSEWVLAIGGAGPDSEWFYSAATAPTSWPGDAASPWVNGVTEPDLPPDWQKYDGTLL